MTPPCASPRAPSNGAEPARSGKGLPAFAASIELAVFAAGVIAVLVAAAVDSGFGAERAWTLVTVLAAALHRQSPPLICVESGHVPRRTRPLALGDR